MEHHFTVYRFCAGFCANDFKISQCPWLVSRSSPLPDSPYCSDNAGNGKWNLHVAAQVLPFQLQVLLSEYVRRKGGTLAADVLKCPYNAINTSREMSDSEKKQGWSSAMMTGSSSEIK